MSLPMADLTWESIFSYEVECTLDVWDIKVRVGDQ